MERKEGLHLVPIDLDGLRAVYPAMTADFPPTERKSLDKMERLMRAGISEGWLLMEDGQAQGYAFLLRMPGEEFVLLDYYAISPERRGWNLGSRGLSLLRKQYPGGIFLEAEAPEAAETAEERTIRERRVAFYQRAGFLPCPFENSVFGVRYLVHLWARAVPENRSCLAARLLYRAYQCQLPQEVFRRQIHIIIPE